MPRNDHVFEMMRRQQGKPRRPIMIQFNWRSILAFLGLFAIGYSAKSWYDIQAVLYPGNAVFAALLGFGIALGAPALLSFLIPMTSGGMLYQKVTAKTWGFVAVVGMTIYYLYYCFQLLWAWNAAQPAVTQSGLVYQQVFIQLILYIGIPAICFAPISQEELVAQIEQAQYVKRYELASIGEMIMLEQTVKRGHELALIGLANMVVDEREEYAGIMGALVEGQQKSLYAVGNLVERTSGVALPDFPFAEDLADLVNLAQLAITNKLKPERAGKAAQTSLQRIDSLATRRPRNPMTKRLSLSDDEYQEYIARAEAEERRTSRRRRPEFSGGYEPEDDRYDDRRRRYEDDDRPRMRSRHIG